MKKGIIVGLFGLDFTSNNLGCGALAYSFLTLLTKRICRETECSIIVFNVASDKEIQDIPKEVSLENVKYKPKSIKSNKYLAKRIKECDVVFDFTGGDSFSDIYGMKRFIAVSLTKMMVIKSHSKLILGPQTYGPTNSFVSKAILKYIVRNSYRVYSRDYESTRFLQRNFLDNVKTYIDVAFALPYDPTMFEWSSRKRKIGINVSGLLWNGGYTGDNQFGLFVNYREYIESIIETLSRDENNEIHLISHVLAGKVISPDNDIYAIEYIKEKYSNCIVAPDFKNPMEAKSYISTMDVFTGARMHSTIAAISSGVAVIPFSYSRKFEGLYNTLDYPYCIGGCTMDTEEAVATTLKYVSEYKLLMEKAAICRNVALEKIDDFVTDLQLTMDEIE